MANLHLKTMCAYIINNYCSEAHKNSGLEAFGSKRYFTKLLNMCNQAECVVARVHNIGESILLRYGLSKMNA